MALQINARGLKQDELQRVIDRHVEFEKRWKERGPEDLERERKELVKEIGLRLAQLDHGFAADMLVIIKEHHPELFDTEKTV